MSDAKIFYAGPTITGVATRNTVYDGTPEALSTAIRAFPYLEGLCLPVSQMSMALSPIERRQGGIYQLYEKAVQESERIRTAARFHKANQAKKHLRTAAQESPPDGV